MGKIIIKRTSNDGYHFTIVANNGQVVGVSQTYKSLNSAKNGIKSVSNNRNSKIEDQTVSDYKELGFDFDLRMCRRTYGQRLIDNGADINTVSRMMGPRPPRPQRSATAASIRRMH